MNVKLIGLSMLALIMVLSGCSSTNTREDGSQGDGSVAGSGGAQTNAAQQGAQCTGLPLDNPNSLLSSRNIYFDYDQSTIRSEFYPMLREHAQYLNSNRQANVTIEGHADERGSREYNIALGERRASAVRRFFEAEGVSMSQINIVSYGEERPLDYGNNEAAWSQNRRAVLVY